MAEKIIDRRDIVDRIINDIMPQFFDLTNVDKGRVSNLGALVESDAKSIEDTIILEQTRAENYLPELSTNEIQVRQTAQLRNVGITSATPATCYAKISMLKDDIHNKGTIVSSTERQFLIDRRSTILNNNIPFSLEDDILIREVIRPDGKMVYTANYTGEDRAYDSYIQIFDDINDQNEGIISLVLLVYQRRYNIQEKIVTDELEFLIDGIDFDYENLLCGFDVYYKQSYGSSFTKADVKHYLTNESEGKYLYYDDDDRNLLTILNNQLMGIGANATIRVEMQETLGEDGMLAVGSSPTSFELYRDNSYTYSGVHIDSELITDPVSASNGDEIQDIKTKLIREKTVRKNLTTMIDILGYIQDIDANVQIIKKRNDVQDRHYYLYTLLRASDKSIIPTTTKTLYLTDDQFDIIREVSQRKIIKANHKFELHVEAGDRDHDYTSIVPVDTNEKGHYYVNHPFLMVFDKYNVMSYHFNSIDADIPILTVKVNDLFPYQMIARSIRIYRNAVQQSNDDTYYLSVDTTLNTSNDIQIVDDEGNIIDPDRVIAYVMFRKNNVECAYLMMHMTRYDPSDNSRTFTFTGSFKTSDFITDTGYLEISDGMQEIGTGNPYNSVIDYQNGIFEIGFLYNETGNDDPSETYDPSGIYAYIPGIEKYTLMNVYSNTDAHTYDLIIDMEKFSRSPCTITRNPDGKYLYTIKEVPYVEYTYSISNIFEVYREIARMAPVYSEMIKQTTDFDVSLKFIATYGQSKYIYVTGGKDENGEEIDVPLNNLNPSLRFRVYGNNISIIDIRQFIYEYMRDHFITPDNLEDIRLNSVQKKTIFISNICTDVEKKFPKIRSIKYLGVDNFDASYQQFTYEKPIFIDVDGIMRYIPEQLNITDIQIDLDET